MADFIKLGEKLQIHDMSDMKWFWTTTAFFDKKQASFLSFWKTAKINYFIDKSVHVQK